MPSLEKLVGAKKKNNRAPERQSDAEMAANIRAWGIVLKGGG
jgi:hypothetical protein